MKWRRKRRSTAGCLKLAADVGQRLIYKSNICFNKEHKRTCHKKPLLQRIRCQHLVESSALLLFLSPPSSLPPSSLPVNYLAGSVSFNEKRSPPPSSLASVLPPPSHCAAGRRTTCIGFWSSNERRSVGLLCCIPLPSPPPPPPPPDDKRNENG